jgi:hypothetical protein
MPTNGAMYAQKLLMGLGWQNAGRANDVILLLALSWQRVGRTGIFKLSMGLGCQ